MRETKFEAKWICIKEHGEVLQPASAAVTKDLSQADLMAHPGACNAHGSMYHSASEADGLWTHWWHTAEDCLCYKLQELVGAGRRGGGGGGAGIYAKCPVRMQVRLREAAA